MLGFKKSRHYLISIIFTMLVIAITIYIYCSNFSHTGKLLILIALLIPYLAFGLYAHKRSDDFSYDNPRPYPIAFLIGFLTFIVLAGIQVLLIYLNISGSFATFYIKIPTGVFILINILVINIYEYIKAYRKESQNKQ